MLPLFPTADILRSNLRMHVKIRPTLAEQWRREEQRRGREKKRRERKKSILKLSPRSEVALVLLNLSILLIGQIEVDLDASERGRLLISEGGLHAVGSSGSNGRDGHFVFPDESSVSIDRERRTNIPVKVLSEAKQKENRKKRKHGEREDSVQKGEVERTPKKEGKRREARR